MTNPIQDKLAEALEEIKATLQRENETPGGSICGTIWHGPGETLFDFIDNTLAAHKQQAAAGEVMADEQIARLKFDLRQAMIEYGSACKADHKEGIRETTTRAVTLINALAALASQPQQAEPVAWRYRMRGDPPSSWIVSPSHEILKAAQKPGGEIWEVEPLYTAPHPATDLVQQLAEAKALADSEGTRAVEYLRRARKAEASLSAFHHLMNKHGLHPGRTDDDLLEILDTHLSAPQPAAVPAGFKLNSLLCELSDFLLQDMSRNRAIELSGKCEAMLKELRATAKQGGAA